MAALGELERLSLGSEVTSFGTVAISGLEKLNLELGGIVTFSVAL